MNDTALLLNLVGYASIAFALLVLGRLSQRLSNVTRAPAYYIGIYSASVFLLLGRIAYTVMLLQAPEWVFERRGEFLLVLLGSGLPAIGITISLVIVWYYWSWLLAER